MVQNKKDWRMEIQFHRMGPTKLVTKTWGEGRAVQIGEA